METYEKLKFAISYNTGKFAYAENLQTLLEKFYNNDIFIDSLNSDGSNLLFHEWQNDDDYIAMVEYLVAKGLNVNHKNVRGYTPLYHYLMDGRKVSIQIVELFLQLGAKTDIMVGNQSLMTALISYYIVTENLSYPIFEVIEVMQKYGFDVNARNDDGGTVLHAMYSSISNEMIIRLIHIDVNPDALDNQNRTFFDRLTEKRDSYFHKWTLLTQEGFRPSSYYVERQHRINIGDEITELNSEPLPNCFGYLTQIWSGADDQNTILNNLYQELFNREIPASISINENCKRILEEIPSPWWIQQQKLYYNSLNKDQKLMLEAYSLYGDGLVNEYLRTGTLKDTTIQHYAMRFLSPNNDITQLMILYLEGKDYYSFTVFLLDFVRDYAVLLQQIILNAPKVDRTFTVFRGLKTTDYIEDDNMRSAGILSTSVSSTIALNFARGYMLQITVPEGASCMINFESTIPDEHEIILPHNSLFYVYERTMQDYQKSPHSDYEWHNTIKMILLNE